MLCVDKRVKMFRTNIYKGFRAARLYSTTPAPATSASNLTIEEQLSNLLARVDALGKRDETKGARKFINRKTNGDRNGFNRSYAKSNGGNANRKLNQSQDQNQNGERNFNSQRFNTDRPKQDYKPKPKISEATNQFGELFTQLSGAQTSSPNVSQQNKVKRTSQQNTSFNQRRTQKPFNGFSKAVSGRPSAAKKANTKRQSTTITNRSPRSASNNPNYESISTSYSPEQLSFTDLMLNSPLTSQTESSRLLKAYQKLAADSNADVSGILTGKFDNEITSTSKVLSQLKTPALKLNGQTVINSLNSNGSIDYETKIKLLKPLMGLAPVKELNG